MQKSQTDNHILDTRPITKKFCEPGMQPIPFMQAEGSHGAIMRLRRGFTRLLQSTTKHEADRLLMLLKSNVRVLTEFFSK